MRRFGLVAFGFILVFMGLLGGLLVARHVVLGH